MSGRSAAAPSRRADAASRPEHCSARLSQPIANRVQAAVTPQTIAQYRDKRSAKVRANREISLLSHIYNIAREWGITIKENPAAGVRKNKETPRG
ncbi:hypothetical protein D3C81_1905590 [compost metagenome]